MDIFTSAKGKAPGVEPIEEAELKLAEADVAPVPARRGRPRQLKFSLDNPPPDSFDF